MYLITKTKGFSFNIFRRLEAKPKLPKRLVQPPAPPPRPPPRGGPFNAFMGFISRDSDKSEDQKELQNSWKSPQSDGGFSNEVDGKKGSKDPAVIQVEVLAQDENRRKGVYPVPEENENTSLENVVLDVEEKSSDKGKLALDSFLA